MLLSRVKNLEENVCENHHLNDNDLPAAIRRQLVKEDDILNQIIEDFDHEYKRIWGLNILGIYFGTDPVIDAARIYMQI